MARDKQQRIATEAGPVAFANPFAALEIQGRESQSGGPGVPLVTKPSTPPKKERLLLRRYTAHRGGKTVLVLEGFSAAWNAPRLGDLLRDLKSALGCGGKLDGHKLEIQGEQAERLQPLLEARGFAVKRGW